MSPLPYRRRHQNGCFLLRSLYVSKVVKTIVKKGKGEFSSCPRRISSLFSPFVLPYLTRHIIPHVSTAAFAFTRKCRHYQSQKHQHTFYLYVDACFLHFGRRHRHNADLLCCWLLKQRCQGFQAIFRSLWKGKPQTANDTVSSHWDKELWLWLREALRPKSITTKTWAWHCFLNLPTVNKAKSSMFTISFSVLENLPQLSGI